MEVFVAYAKKLVEEAKAIVEISDLRDKLKLHDLPLTEPPENWKPAGYSEEHCKRFERAVCNLHKIAKSIRAEGVNLVKTFSVGWEEHGQYAKIDLMDAIAEVDRFLKSA